jgi:hypothetical protein
MDGLSRQSGARFDSSYPTIRAESSDSGLLQRGGALRSHAPLRVRAKKTSDFTGDLWEKAVSEDRELVIGN